MSKIIKLTSDYIAECREDFEKALQNTKLSDGRISFTKTLQPRLQRKATLYFTAEAWAKVVMLLQEFNNEVAWHGVAHRQEGENDADAYVITDILVYPQEVTGATVEMDTEKYAVWLQENDEDERFYNIRMQGHSHVNMQPTPSSVDLSHQESILEQLGDGDFYIFMIYNKSFKRNIKIYDLQKNTLFEDADIRVKLCGAAVDLDEFIADAQKLVTNKPYTSPVYLRTDRVGFSHTPATTAAQEKPSVQIGSGWRGSDASSAHPAYNDDDRYADYYLRGGR